MYSVHRLLPTMPTGRPPLNERAANKTPVTSPTNKTARESFDDIYLDLSKKPGKCRIAESGLGWKPPNGETFTLDKSECISAQWSRAARGHELKVYARNAGVVLLDGFKQDVSHFRACGGSAHTHCYAGLRDNTKVLQSLVRR